MCVVVRNCARFRAREFGPDWSLTCRPGPAAAAQGEAIRYSRPVTTLKGKRYPPLQPSGLKARSTSAKNGARSTLRFLSGCGGRDRNHNEYGRRPIQQSEQNWQCGPSHPGEATDRAGASLRSQAKSMRSSASRFRTSMMATNIAIS